MTESKKKEVKKESQIKRHKKFTNLSDIEIK